MGKASDNGTCCSYFAQIDFHFKRDETLAMQSEKIESELSLL